MKNKIVILLLFVISSSLNAQSILGTYEQEVITAPTEYRDGQKDVVITKDKDPKLEKKIWISNLIKNQKFYAVYHSAMNGQRVYSVPSQIVGGYAINAGCIIFSETDEDDEEGKLLISLNNDINCIGMDQKDYDGPVAVGDKGVSAGGVKVGKNGEVTAPGVEIKDGNVSVDSKKIMEGIQYIGYKKG